MKENYKNLKEILKNIRLEYSVADFSLIKDKLIKCNAQKRIPENARSVIVFLFPYKVEEQAPENISRYATVKDYHILVSEKLESIKNLILKDYPGGKAEVFCDNSPIPEVYTAALCKLGVIGKNNLLINEKYGSFVFIGEIVTDIDFLNENNKNTTQNNTEIKYCINCKKCIENCPTGFLKDKTVKCLSDITQQKKPLEKVQEDLIKKYNTVWGCDVCQNVCAMNKNKKLTDIKDFVNSYRNEYVLNEDNKDRAYNWRGEEIIKRNLEVTLKK